MIYIKEEKIKEALAEKSALLRIDSHSYFEGTIVNKSNGERMRIHDYINEVLNPIINGNN